MLETMEEGAGLGIRKPETTVPDNVPEVEKTTDVAGGSVDSRDEDWVKGKLAAVTEGMSLEQRREEEILSAVERHGPVLADCLSGYFSGLEREWEDARQRLQTKSTSIRANDEQRLSDLRKEMDAIGALLDALRAAGNGGPYAERARRCYRI